MIGREPPKATTCVIARRGSASSVLQARLSACAGSSSTGHAGSARRPGSRSPTAARARARHEVQDVDDHAAPAQPAHDPVAGLRHPAAARRVGLGQPQRAQRRRRSGVLEAAAVVIAIAGVVVPAVVGVVPVGVGRAPPDRGVAAGAVPARPRSGRRRASVESVAERARPPRAWPRTRRRSSPASGAASQIRREQAEQLVVAGFAQSRRVKKPRLHAHRSRPPKAHSFFLRLGSTRS